MPAPHSPLAMPSPHSPLAMSAPHIALGVLVLVLGAARSSSADYAGCEALSGSRYCTPDSETGFYPYTPYVKMPNSMGEDAQEDASSTIDYIASFVVGLGIPTAGDNNYRLFTCSVFLPPCLENGLVIQPCRQLCEVARLAARPMQDLGHRWPDDFRCDKFPDQGDRSVKCIPPVPGSTPTQRPVTGGGGGAGVNPGGTGGHSDHGGEAATTAETGVDEEDGAGDGVVRPGPVNPGSTCVDVTREFSLNRCTCTCPP